MHESDFDFNRVTLFADHQSNWTNRFNQSLTRAGLEVGIVCAVAESLNGDVLCSSLVFQVIDYPLSLQLPLVEQAVSLGGRAIVLGKEPAGETALLAKLHGAVAYFNRSVDFRPLIDYLKNPNERARWAVQRLNQQVSSSLYRAINPADFPGHLDK